MEKVSAVVQAGAGNATHPSPVSSLFWKRLCGLEEEELWSISAVQIATEAESAGQRSPTVL